MTPLTVGNRKKLWGATFDERGGCSSTAMLFFARNFQMPKVLCKQEHSHGDVAMTSSASILFSLSSERIKRRKIFL